MKEALEESTGGVHQKKSYFFRYNIHEKISNRYLILDRKKGGMSDVYFCFDLDLAQKNTCVLKTLSAFNDNDFLNSLNSEAFRNELNIWSDLGLHPNIVTCKATARDIFEIPYMYLEWVYNRDYPNSCLNILLDNEFDMSILLRMIIGICEGMAYANKKIPGIVHGDIRACLKNKV